MWQRFWTLSCPVRTPGLRWCRHNVESTTRNWHESDDSYQIPWSVRSAYWLLIQKYIQNEIVAFLDIDEILVSRAPNVSSVLTFLKTNPDVCNYQVKHVLFRKSWPDDGVSQDSDIATYQVHSLLKTKRDDHIWAFNKRSKYIARVDMLEIPGIHYAHSLCHGINVPYHENWHPGIIKDFSTTTAAWTPVNSLLPLNSSCVITLYSYRNDIMRQIKRIHTIMDRLNTTIRGHVQSRTDNIRIWHLWKRWLYFWRTYTRQAAGGCWLAYNSQRDILCIRKHKVKNGRLTLIPLNITAYNGICLEM